MRQYTEEMRRRSLYLAIFFTIAFITLAFFNNRAAITISSATEAGDNDEISSADCLAMPDN